MTRDVAVYETMRGAPKPRSLVPRLRGCAVFVAGAVIGIVVSYLALERRGEQPQAWHRLEPEGELRADDAARVPDLAAYLRLERDLFDEGSAELARRAPGLPPLSRFDPSSPSHPSRFDRDWNRTFELWPPGEPRGEALLLHGLSDSPYSLRAIARLLVAQGYHVLGLRLPGHGVVPGGLATVTRDDWRAAVRLGVRGTGGRAAAAGRPFVLVGYSSGAALALDYTLHALRHGGEPVPTRLVFLSPAFAVTRAAALAPWRVRIGRLPGLAKLALSPIEPEFDPFKFNSFPLAAGAELYRLTRELDAELRSLEGARPPRPLPPLLTIQSVVDATVPPVESLTRLYRHVERRQEQASELLLFDANRRAEIASLLGPQADELLALAHPGQRFAFRVTLVTNADAGSFEVVAKSRAPDTLETVVTPLGLAWPPGVYSLSHVAVPFPPDDPVYGTIPASGHAPFPLGALEIKGERGAFRVPATLLARLRYNPFFAVVENHIAAFLAD